MNTSPEQIANAYDLLHTARENLFNASQEAVDAKSILTMAEAKAVAVGVEGKNVEIRKANLNIAFCEEEDALFNAEKKLARCRYLFDQSQSYVELIRLLMRYDAVAWRGE